MSAIYQRARPIHWDQVIGQEHIKGVLKAALDQGRVGHAYLFSGPRGVGKTTTARLIAMTANCTGPEPKPCGECESCRAVRAGSHPDVLEIDAASNNSVDDVRDLREKVGLAPMRGGKKIYILDEAHMMSRAAFNALLKTLEEPPEHVIFILATTEPEKIIPTILSRCQHYRFRRLSADEIAGKLAGLAEAEGVAAEPEALGLMGRLADGAMRDGESLLERMLAAGTAVTRRAVEEALGLPPGEQMRSLAGSLVRGEAGTALAAAGELYRAGFAARTVVEGLVEALSQAIHAELGVSDSDAARLEGADTSRLLRLQAALDEQESRFARAADLLSLELALTHALLAADGGGEVAESDARPAPRPQVRDGAELSELSGRLERLERDLAALRGSGTLVAAAPTASVVPTQPTPPAARPVAPARAAPQVAAPAGGTWADVIQAVSMQTRAFLKPARMYAEAGYVSLSYDARSSFHAKQVGTKLDELTPLIEQVFGPVTLEIITADGGRKYPVGGGAAAAGAAPAPVQGALITTPQPAPMPVSRAAPTAPVQAASDVVDDFDPLARRAPVGRPQTAAPAPEPVQEQAAEQPAPLRPADPPSPDDRAPAPLPDASPPWQEDPAQVPPAPAGTAEQTPETPQETATREMYLGEPVTEEPVWDDLGLPAEMIVSGGGRAGGAERAKPADAPALSPRPAASVPVSAPPMTTAASGAVRDIRAHPRYEDFRSRFSGQVREIGKNRQAPVAEVEQREDEGSGG
ncbi:DNA polymerase III subunit gamma/tau [Deinococcus radiophilus]|uniref:DNA polymerase III subunit gamma/tau n=1 Tax=Deinococcus radiophilus TaxID=32062 RepID=UPI001E330867|nr:DNA polymerase III subunit gamma/tau [Deinococcus radiophilus]UFA51211.1 DNA polymerase III subunit gamma/tau [Deinococcus radiophilus]